MEGFVAQLEEAVQTHPELADTLAPLRESARRFMLDDLDRQLRAVDGTAPDGTTPDGATPDGATPDAA
jgi:hypothetical protein